MELDFHTEPSFNALMSNTRKTSQLRAPDELRQEAIGERLKAVRLAHGLKALDIAIMLGCEPNYWSRWENGRRPIPLDMAYKLTKVFEVDLDYIFLGDIRAIPMDLRGRLSSHTPL